MSNKPASFKRLEVQYGFRTKTPFDKRTDKKAMAIKTKQSTYNKRMSAAMLAAKKFVIKSVSMLSRSQNKTIKIDM